MKNIADITGLDVPLIDLGVPPGSRIIVAMSGGVDSSVAAGLCAHGLAIQKKGACCAGQDIYDAQLVSKALNIPHYVLDYEDRFSDSVMDDFADTYLAGATPIPCVRCNERVKFRDLMETARDLGGVAMVTGHYIRRLEGARGAELHRAVDHDKDQSYFLFSTKQEQLDYLRFPLGGMRKDEVRLIAEKFGLAVADKPDSQDICFVPEGKYSAVVERLRPGASEPGEIVHVDGTVMGRHPGILHYTVGQRRGLGVAIGDPLYVVRLDPEHRQVIVGPRESLLIRRIWLKELTWLGDIDLNEAGEQEMELAVKVRSTRPPAPARLVRDGARIGVELHTPEEGVAPGQACVFYEQGEGKTRVLGGGWIEATQNAVMEPSLNPQAELIG